ncbi:DNA-3-methyladenine glycosylase 2 [Ruminococcaceae bacterium OttesenSCG-928-A16]|nr:DNA-3-methyladenine glycosylase 2 [Ruminococcaceae bacterium OttesenSCG-928-A16]
MAELTNNAILLPAHGLCLATTLFCGQTFSWQATGPQEYVGTAGNRCVTLRQKGDAVEIEKHNGAPFSAQDTTFWQHYLALDMDYPALLQRFATHKKLQACVQASPGIRVLRQPFFDTLLSFIISQNNHIARITGIVNRLKEGFGEPIGKGQYAFPAAEALAGLAPEDLADLRAGFRAKYLIDAAQKVASGAVEEAKLRSLPDEEARQQLTTIFGVGNKVADCVLLYGLWRTRVVPMDVWMKRAMASTFPKGMPAAARGYEGIAQQYIFDWARQNLK